MELPVLLVLLCVGTAAGSYFYVWRTRRLAGQSEQHFELLTEALPGTAAFPINRDGRIAGWNAAAERFFEYRPVEVLHQPIAIFESPSEAGVCDALLAEAATCGQSSRDLWLVRRDGSKSRASLTIRARRDHRGTTVEFLALARDLSGPPGEVAGERLLDALIAFVGVLSPEGVLLDANRAPLEAAGITRGDVIGKPFWETYWWSHSPDAQELLRAAVARAQRGEPSRFDVEVLMRDRLMAIDFMLQPLRDETGRITHLIPSAVPIDERKRAERDLLENERLFRGTFENAAVGIALLALDGHWLRVNQRLCSVTGYSEQELRELTFADITHPDDVGPDWSFAHRLLAGEIDSYSMEKRYRRKDGSLVWVNLTCSLQRDHSGAPAYFIAVVEDINARKLAEDALRASESRLRLAMLAGKTGAWEFDTESGEAVWSSELRELLGVAHDYTPSLGAFLDLVHPGDRALLSAHTAAVLDGAEPDVVDFRVVRPDSAVRWFTAQTRIIDRQDGRPKRLMGVLADITGRKVAEQRLLDSREFLNRITAIAPTMLYVFDLREQRYVWINNGVRFVLGFTSEQIQNAAARPQLDLHPDDRLAHDRHRLRLRDLDIEDVAEVECRMRHQNGAWIWLSIRDKVYQRDASGEVTQIIGAARDITFRKRSEDAVRASEERFRNVFENAATGIAVAGPDGLIQQCNAAYSALFGVPEAELRGTPLPGLPPLETLWTSEVSQWENEQHHLRSDGSAVWMRQFISLLRGEAGSAGHLMALVADITSRKRAESDMAFLIRLDQEIAARHDPEQLATVALQQFAAQIAADSCTLSEFDPGTGCAVSRYRWTAQSSDSETGSILEDPHILQRLAQAETVTGDSFAFAPYLRAGRLVGTVSVGSRTPRSWHPGDLWLLRELVSRIWPALERIRAVDALRESEQRLRLALDAAQAGTFDIAVRNSVAPLVSDSLMRLFALPVDSSPRLEDLLHRVHPEDRERIPQSLAQLTHPGSEFVEFRIVRPGGEITWLASRAEVFNGPDGQPDRVLGAVIDVTARKQAEDAVRDSEARFRALAEAVPSVLFSTRPDGWCDFISPNFFQITGFTPEQSYGLGWMRAIHPDDRTRIRAAWENSIATGQLFEVEHRFRRSDGVYRWFVARALPMRGEDFRIVKWFGSATDIDELKCAQDAMRESEARFRQISEAAPIIVWVANASGGVEYCNKRWSEFTGQSQAQVLRNGGTGWLDALHPDDLAVTTHAWADALRSGQPYQIESRLRRHDGAYRWILSRGLPVRDSSGRVIRWVGANADIHDQKEAEITLRRANQDLKQFAWAASHDLQEPLRMVVNFTSLLERRFADKLDETGLQFIRYAVEGAHRMQSLLKGLRDYWQASERGAQPPSPVDLTAVVEEAVGNLQTSIAEAGAHVTHGPLPTVTGNHTPLVQVFQNLISNAVKYRHPDRAPHVNIRADRHGRDWRIAVEDNGIGIAPAYREQIFGIFRRLHRADQYSGTGIGLALCQIIVERHGGRIWVDSEAGQGSRFYFTLPSA